MKIETKKLCTIDNIDYFLKCSTSQETFLVHLLERFTDRYCENLLQNNIADLKVLLSENDNIIDYNVLRLILTKLLKVDKNLLYDAKTYYKKVAVADDSDRFKEIEEQIKEYFEVDLLNQKQIIALMKKADISDEEIKQHFKDKKKKKLF